MSEQFDMLELLTVASNEVGKMDMAAALPSRSWQWDLLLARLPDDARLTIHVSPQWLGVVVEQLVDRVMGRRILWHTGNITTYPAPPEFVPSRTVYMTDDGARSLHRQMPLVELERGECWVRFRPAGAGETSPATLDFPTTTKETSECL